MFYTALYKRITGIIVCLLALITSYAADGDSVNRKTVPLVNQPARYTSNTTSRQFAQLDQYISSQQGSIRPAGTEFTEQFFEQFNSGDPVAERYKAQAKAALDM